MVLINGNLMAVGEFTCTVARDAFLNRLLPLKLSVVFSIRFRYLVAVVDKPVEAMRGTRPKPRIARSARSH